MGEPGFEELQERAADAVADDELVSVYAGLVGEDGGREYYFGNDTEDGEKLRETAAVQLGMMVRVLADRSESTVEELTDLAAERAEQMELR
ncbi:MULTISPECIES: hypothetical protein [Halorussus]|uniref:hypothetical protein n=1 Tax=Halorussus TaxID=1070314 RepID=UPI000E20E4FC|nr:MULTISPECIES: hypothetical protein [Halorussus]NHN58731.1 hypothetical protein [Halorussus sp. JP-T4]